MTPLTSRIFYHASYILLHRPTVDPQDLASASGPAGICLEHSRAAHELATRFGRTFGKYMRYLPRYSWFVAASFDVVLLDSHVAQVQEAALDRLTVWLQIMEQVGRSLGLLSLALLGRSEKENRSTVETHSRVCFARRACADHFKVSLPGCTRSSSSSLSSHRLCMSPIRARNPGIMGTVALIQQLWPDCYGLAD